MDEGLRVGREWCVMDHLIKPEWSTLKRLMFMKAASGGSLNEYEIIGNPAVFQTNVAKPLSGFTIPFLPVQQGTGDLSPDNVRPITGWSGAKFTRSGKNMFLYNADNVKQNNAVSGSTQLGTRAVYHTGIFADGQTTFSLSAYRKNADAPTGRNLNYGWFIGGVASSKGYFIKETEEVEVNTNPSAGAEIVLITTNDNVSTMQSNIQKYNIQIEVGSSASPYAEYTGASYPVTFPATGKNLCSLGDKTVTRSQKFSLGATLQPGTYTLSIVATSTDTDDNRCLVSIWDGETVVATHDFPRNERHSWTFTAQSEFNAIYLYASDSWGHGEGDTATFTDVMLNTGSTALPYEPFTNTVYGGTLDAVTGVLSVERCHVKVKWGEFVHDATYENTKRGHIR